MSWRSRTLLCTVALAEVALVAWLVHDWLSEPTTERTVRRLVDATGLDLTVVDSGEPLALGWSPMVLVICNRDGSLQLHEVVRDPGQRGGMPDVVRWPLDPVIVEDEPGDPPKPATSATDTEEWRPNLAVDPRLELVVRSEGDRCFMGTSARPDVVSAATFEDSACLAFLAALHARSAKAGDWVLNFAAPVTIRAREMLQLWVHASALGWSAFWLPFSEESWRAVATGALPELREFPKQHGWQTGWRSRLLGEVLIAVDGDTPWDQLGTLHGTLCRLDVDDVSFVVKSRDGSLRKLRTPLPRN